MFFDIPLNNVIDYAGLDKSITFYKETKTKYSGYVNFISPFIDFESNITDYLDHNFL